MSRDEFDVYEIAIQDLNNLSIRDLQHTNILGFV